MKSWNYRLENRVSWVTGLPTQPAKPCRRCKNEATCWVANDYTSGRSGRTATAYQPYCRQCAEQVVNAKSPTATEESSAMATATKSKGRKKSIKEQVESPAAPPPAKAVRGRRKVKESEEKVTEVITPTVVESATPVQSDLLTEREAMLVVKHKDHAIIPGSLRTAGAADRPGWGHKWTVVIKCCSCRAERILATSDLQWDTTKYCTSCAADVKRNRRQTKEVKKGLK